MGVDEMGVDKMGVDKMGVDKMGVDEMGTHRTMYLLCWVHANTTTRIFDIQAGDSLRDAIGYPCTVYTKYRNVIICTV